MKQYQVTRKLQVTIPKKLADKTGIRPGDSVVFEETGNDAIILKKVAGSHEKSKEVERAIEEFGKDLARIRAHVKGSESAILENLSRHVSSK